MRVAITAIKIGARIRRIYIRYISIIYIYIYIFYIYYIYLYIKLPQK